MIPPLNPPNSDEDRERLADLVTRAHRDYAAPPTPIRGLEYVDVVLTGRRTWRQPAPDQLTANSHEGRMLEPDQLQRVVAADAAKVTNPVRDLAAALVEFADQLDSQGVVPLGIHVCTAHSQSPSQFYWDTGHVAQVVTTVRGVRREWLDQHRTPAKPVSNAVAPTDCACRNWAVDIRTGRWGVEHHPKCDGTGQHKSTSTEETPQP